MNNSNIENKLTGFYDAFNNKKWEIVEEYLSNDFSYFTDNCKIQNKHGFISFMQADDWKGESFELGELKIRQSKSRDLAFATYGVRFEGTTGGTKMKIQAIETVVFQLEEYEWKILHFHVTNRVIN